MSQQQLYTKTKSTSESVNTKKSKFTDFQRNRSILTKPRNHKFQSEHASHSFRLFLEDAPNTFARISTKAENPPSQSAMFFLSHFSVRCLAPLNIDGFTFFFQRIDPADLAVAVGFGVLFVSNHFFIPLLVG